MLRTEHIMAEYAASAVTILAKELRANGAISEASISHLRTLLAYLQKHVAPDDTSTADQLHLFDQMLSGG